jgi:hypothetical protein
MCQAVDPITGIHCLRGDNHREHVAMGRDWQAHWSVTWFDTDEVMRQILTTEKEPHAARDKD